MKVIYAILLTTGWIWLPIATALIWWRLRWVKMHDDGGTNR